MVACVVDAKPKIQAWWQVIPVALGKGVMTDSTRACPGPSYVWSLHEQVLSATLSESEEIPLHYFERTPSVYRMLLHTVFTPERVVNFSPGTGVFAVECIAQRVPTILVVASEAQRQLLLKCIKETLIDRIKNKNDRRFYREQQDEARNTVANPSPSTTGGGAQDAARTQSSAPAATTAAVTPAPKALPNSAAPNDAEPEEHLDEEESSSSSTE